MQKITNSHCNKRNNAAILQSLQYVRSPFNATTATPPFRGVALLQGAGGALLSNEQKIAASRICKISPAQVGGAA